MPIALHQTPDDSHKPVRPAARTPFTGRRPSAALPFTAVHRTGRPPRDYLSQLHLYLVIIISLIPRVVNSFFDDFKNLFSERDTL